MTFDPDFKSEAFDVQPLASNFEIIPTGQESSLLDLLRDALSARGFTLLGVVAQHDEDSCLVTLGDPRTTRSQDFAGVLRLLADEIDHNAKKMRHHYQMPLRDGERRKPQGQ